LRKTTTVAARRFVDEFIQKESAGGLALIAAMLLALILSNSPLEGLYSSFLHIPIDVRVGALELKKSLYHWVNDGLMVIFFLLVGLEVKREIVEGHLSSVRQAVLPVIAAMGGIAVPAAIYVLLNRGNPVAMRGWAIPTATDIAFALGVLALLGRRAPVSLKILLMALAIIDDLGAIVIIGIFYTEDLSLLSMLVAGIALAVLILFNRLHVARKAPYFLVGTVLWISVLKSGVHATLAGVALAFTIPLTVTGPEGGQRSPLREIEHDLHAWVAFLIMPLFAFVNAGVDVTGIAFGEVDLSMPLGIALGLFLGKQLGVFGFSWLSIKLKLAKLPAGSGWGHLYGVAVLTGIGFTMSLFIASLAFTDDRMFQYTDRLAILAGSFLSGILGFLILRLLPAPRTGEPASGIGEGE